jgi:NADH:ubiquinone oxidoreductase subunit F (NADH-binding)
MEIIKALKESGLTGRSGSGFPTGLKWEMVKNNKGKKKYIICNASEGEPKVSKDKYILENYAEEVINGIKIALDTFRDSEAIIYINKEYYPLFKTKLTNLSKGLPISLFKKGPGYIAGEETTILEVIEGRRAEPRKKPPFPVEKGLYGMPTLINNVETFYYISKIFKGEYFGTRFYSITGDVKSPGVYELSADWSTKKILEETDNYPTSEFFIQIGGGACGEIFLEKELKNKPCGSGSIIVFDKKKTKPIDLMKEWADFYMKGNCNKCVPCREGGYRIVEALNEKKVNWERINEILFVLKETSFCSLGKSIYTPFSSLIKKILNEKK